ncbi:hypothetical protein GQ54DRAFT_43938 [Martensiomyces pterosporus]|nr:hypothetical protein GQ54DRAFT_43938 [Martensiomyces pterosporus]
MTLQLPHNGCAKSAAEIAESRAYCMCTNATHLARWRRDSWAWKEECTARLLSLCFCPARHSSHLQETAHISAYWQMMKHWVSVSSLVSCLAAAVAGDSCVAGSYRCASASGQGSVFYQCDVGGVEVQKSCAPGTVCYTQGSSILCGFPVSTANQLAPENSSLTAGAQCSYASPFDEYVCPGANGQYDYFLRCLSGTFVHFACPPGTACVKNPGQNMFCGWKSQANGSKPNVPSAAANPTSPATLSSTSLLPDTSALPSSLISEFSSAEGSASGTPATSTTPASESGASEGTSSSSSRHGLFDNLPPLFPDRTSSSSSSSSEGMGMGMGMESSTETGSSSASSAGGLFGGLFSDTGASTSASDETAAASATSSGEEASSSLSSPAPTPEGAHGSGLTGAMISNGVEMVLNNGISLPFPLPNIDLPAMDLASVHLPDVTLDGIAVTGIPLPSITIPPLNPASLTKFTYIEEIMSRAGITFDDIAKLPLPDLNHISLPNLGSINVANIMGMLNLGHNQDSNSPANRNAQPTGPTATANGEGPQTTTLDAGDIDAVLGLSISTYASG